MRDSKKKKRKEPRLVMLDISSAGADLGSKEHYVSVPVELVGEGEPSCRRFGTYTEELESLADWLISLGITSIAMEATGVYWLGIYEVLENRGIEVFVVNARHLKNVGGRKTDVGDSDWIQTLHSYRLLRKSFIPDEEIRNLRAIQRQRENLEKDRSRSILHIHKALDMMNLKIHQYISDMAGVAGMKLLSAIAGGEKNPAKLSEFHNKGFKSTKDDWKKALKGNYKDTHVFGLRQALERYDFYMRQMKECDLNIERQLILLSSGEYVEPIEKSIRPRKLVKRNQNDPDFDAASYLYSIFGVDIMKIDGIGEKVALTILSEAGYDMSRWPTSQHFTSWLGLAPIVKISGGKLLGHHSGSTSNRAAQAFRNAAMGLARSKCRLGEFYRSLRYRKGAIVANKATARKIAVFFYTVVKKQEEYSPNKNAEHLTRQKARKLKKLQLQAGKLGLELKEITPNPNLQQKLTA